MESSYEYKQVIVVRKDLNMRKGKLAAQVAHASNMPLFKLIDMMQQFYLMENRFEINQFTEEYLNLKSVIDNWRNTAYTKIVVGCSGESELKLINEAAKNMGVPSFMVYDKGLTEFHGKETLTCCSIGPAIKDQLDTLTGYLSLL